MKGIQNHEKRKSRCLFERAVKTIPGGVNSPVRACKAVGADPLFIDHADGCMLLMPMETVFIDYVGSWGPMILGHRHPRVMEALFRDHGQRDQFRSAH